MRPLSILFIFLPFIGACSASEESIFSNKGSVESKPSTSELQTASFAILAKKAVTASYDIKLSSASGLEICTGESSIVIMSDFSLEIPKALVKCLSIEINLAEILKSARPRTDRTHLSSDSKVLYIDAIDDATFAPPRPLLIGPIIQDASIYQDFSQETEHTLTLQPAGAAPSFGKGTIAIKVNGIKETFKSPTGNESFNDVIHWETVTSGFDGMAIFEGALFDRLEFHWNVRPIMIPRIVITGRLGNFIQTNNPLAGGADALIGSLTVELTVKEYSRF